LRLSRLDLGLNKEDRTETMGCVVRPQFLQVRSSPVTNGLRWRPVRRILSLDEPHRTACYEVLNLPSQVGVLPGGSALALAYRVTFVSLDPL
jgi:hypothetical protein